MGQKFANKARSRIVGTLSDSATSFTIESLTADDFPVADTSDWVVPSDWFKATLENNLGDIEIVHVGVRNAGSAICSNVRRGQEGTTPIAFAAGTIVGLRLTAGDYQDIVNFKGTDNAWTGENTFAQPVAAAAAAEPGELTTLAQVNALLTALSGGLKKLPVNTLEMKTGEVYVTSAGFTLDQGLEPGTIFGVINNSNTPFTITQASGLSLRPAGFTSTGNRELVGRGFAVVFALSANEYYIGGGGLQ